MANPLAVLERQLEELAKKRRALLDTPRQWWNHATVAAELAHVNLEIDRLLDRWPQQKSSTSMFRRH